MQNSKKMEPLRLRLTFNDSTILTKSQKLNGFKRSWILLQSQHRTISDVASHLLRTFDLSDSCPNGIVLSMDGFVLPNFESTAILKDKDLVCVKKRRSKLLRVIKQCGRKKAVVEHKIVEKLPLVTGLLLANEEFEKETGGCQSGTEEDEVMPQSDFPHQESMPNGDESIKKNKASNGDVSIKKNKISNGDVSINKGKTSDGDISIKKRKASNSPKSSKRKRRRENADDSAQKDSLQIGDCGKKSSKHNRDQEHKPGDAQKDLSDANCTTNALFGGLDKNQEEPITPPCLPDNAVKITASRSSRRKRLRRQWERAQRIAEKEQINKKHLQEEEHNADVSSKDQNLNAKGPVRIIVKNHLKEKGFNTDLGPKDQKLDAEEPPNVLDQDSESEDEIVPVVVRPGHIRFSAPGKEKEVQRYEEAEGSFNWNGIINKKQGQKWGMDKQSSSKKSGNKSSYKKAQVSRQSEDISPQEMQSASTWNNYTYPEERQSTQEANCTTQEANCATQEANCATQEANCATQEARPANASVDYEKLPPLTDIPVQGDTIAYRLVELSSSLCPELTSYRVGKVSCFDGESKRIVLVPVPEYPFEFKKAVDDTSDEELPDTSQYNEDGSLEIDYPSLVDARIVKRSSGDLNPCTTTLKHVADGTPPSDLNPSGSGSRAETVTGSKDPSQAQPTSNNGTESNPSPAAGGENGKKDVWEEISAALNAKKSELLKEDNWNKKQKSANGGAWSLRAIRRSAIGPTMALLRSQNCRQTN